jgi:hypothetical protein
MRRWIWVSILLLQTTPINDIYLHWALQVVAPETDAGPTYGRALKEGIYR